MDDTYCLISKLVQTKSIERVLSPIAAQVSQLIIVNEAYENGEKDAFPDDLVPSASIVMHSTQGLVEAATRLVSNTDDEVLKADMPKACEALSVAGTDLLTATQRVQIENYNTVARKHLIRTAKDVLEATLKVLLASDDLEIRKIKRSIQSARERLRVLTAVHSMKTLVPAFKGFADSIMLLISQVDKRQLELSDPRQRESILRSMSTLKKCVPMLNTSLQTFVKYPENPQAKASKLYVVGQITECLDSLVSAIQSKDSVMEDYEEPEKPGHFVSNIDRILSLLCEENRREFVQLGSELDVTVEGIIRHAMAVSHLSQQQHRMNIIQTAQKLLKLRSELCEVSQFPKGSPQLDRSFDSKCESLIAEAQRLEGAVNGATLWLVIDTFAESSEPLERLIKVMLSDDKVTSQQHSYVNVYESEFHQHFDKVGQVARFTAATSVDAKKVRIISNCLYILEHVDPELIPAIQACRSSLGDQAAIEHLRLLKNEWISALNVLVRVIDELIDGRLFIEVSESEMRRDVEKCQHSKHDDADLVRHVTRFLIGRARRVADRAMSVAENNTDVLFRNGIRAYIKKLNKAIPALKSAASSVEENFADLSLHDKLHKRCDAVMKCTTLIKDGVLGKSQMDLLDPDRQDIGAPHMDDREISCEDDQSLLANVKIEKASKSHHSPSYHLKHYISDILRDDVRQLTDNLLSAAIGGHKEKLGLMCTTMLDYSNHLTETADKLATCVTEESNKKSLEEHASRIRELAPEILEKSAKVSECDTYQVEGLHQVTDVWCKEVSSLQTRLDKILVKWKQVSDKLLDAVRLADVQLLSVQIDSINDHQKHVIQMLDKASSLASETSVIMIQKVSSLKQEPIQLESVTKNLITLSEKQVGKNPGDAEHRELEQASRVWSTVIFCVTSTLDRLSTEAIVKFIHKHIEADERDYMKMNKQITEITELNITLKSYIEEALTGCIIEKYISDGEGAMCSLDETSADVTQCYGIMSGIVTPTPEILVLYAPHQMNLLLWKWAATVSSSKSLLNKWTSHFTRHITKFEQEISQLQAHTSSDREDEKNIELVSKRHLDGIKEVFYKVRGKVLDMIQSSDDVDGKNTVRRHLESWAAITDDLQTSGQALLGSADDSLKDKFYMAKLRWGVKCLQIDGCLKSLSAIKYDSISGFIRHLTSDIEQPITVRNTPKSDQRQMPTCNITTTPVSSKLSKKTNPADKDWKQLASGAKVKHFTPEKPSEKSGFKPANILTEMKSFPCYKAVVCDQWQADNNAIVKLARDISEQVHNMAEFTKGMGPIKSKRELISTAKNVATNGEKLIKFARILVKYSTDKRVAEDLQCSTDYIPTVIAQLHILANVKTASPDDRSTEKMLMKTGHNLLDGVNRMLRYAEATCVKGLKQSSDLSPDEREVLALASEWRHRFQRHRLLEYSTAAVDQLGLRKVNHQSTPPTLSHVTVQK